MFINIIYLLIFIITVGYFWVKKRYSYWSDLGVACVEPKFPYGNLSSGYGRTQSDVSFFQSMYRALKGKGPFAGIYMFIRPIILPLDPKFIRTVLVKDFNYFSDRGIYYDEKNDPLSAHLFSVDTDLWRNLRNKLTPTFTSGKMKFMFPTIVGVANELEKSLNDELRKGNCEIEIKDILARFTTDVIGTCAFGLECNSLKDPNAEFRQMGILFLKSNSRLKQLFMLNFRKFAQFFGMKLNSDKVTDFFMGAVKDTIKYREENNIRRKDFMDLLIEMKNTGKLDGEKIEGVQDDILTIQQIAAQCFVFFIAGFETSSSAMSVSLYELSQNQEIQDRARDEVQRIYKKYNNIWTYEAILELKYVDQIISESLRKYPPLPFLHRRVVKDYQVPNTKHIFKTGQTMLIPIEAMHHDPEYFPNPEQYNPDRFTDEEIQKRDPFVYLPFGSGPRNCIGLRFGQMQARVGLAALLLNFKFTPCSRSVKPLIADPKSFFFATIGGIWMKIEKIK